MNLYFEDSFNNYRLIKNDVKDKDEAFPLIEDFVHKLNPNFKIYYVRNWSIYGKIYYDVGSHSEFFILTKDNLV